MNKTFLYLLAMVSLGAGSAARAASRTAVLEEEVRLLRSQVAELRTRVDRLERSSFQQRTAAVAPGQNAGADNRAGARASAPAERPSGSGPLKFNGEFRLYFDSLTRPAGGGAPRVSNIRGRYLLHLDFKAALHPTLSVNARLSTAPLNNPLTDIQDFGAGVAKHPFFLSEAYIDWRPNQHVTLQGGRLDSPFNDRSRFLFDIDTRFNGASEIFRFPLESKPAGLKQIDLIAGQYTFTNPSFPVIQPGQPSTDSTATPSQALLAAGAAPGSQPRASQLFQQGFVVQQDLRDNLSHRLAFDLQLYRNPNQLRLLSTPAGEFLVSTTLGWPPASPFPSPGNATTTPNGAMLSAPGFQIAHLSHTLSYSGLQLATRRLPLSLNVQLARNLGAGFERNAVAAILSAGRSEERGDVRVLYGYYLKQANSLLSELTENDVSIGSNVNMTAHVMRVEFGLARGVVFANNFIFSSFLRSSDPAAGFFVPLGSDVPRQFRYQGILIFRF